MSLERTSLPAFFHLSAMLCTICFLSVAKSSFVLLGFLGGVVFFCFSNSFYMFKTFSELFSILWFIKWTISPGGLQIFALQSCSQAAYVPSSKSSLYQVNWQNTNNQQQPFPGLFQKDQFAPTNPNPNPDKIGFSLFNNATRQQVKDLTKETKCN